MKHKCMSKFILWPSLRCECYFKSCRQTHGAALSVYTDTEPEDHGVQSVDVMLICGVTDCWRRGHLLTVYFCPLPSICLLTSGSGYDDHMCSQAWKGGDPRRWPTSFYPVKQLSSPEQGAHWTLLLPRGELSEPYSTSLAPGAHCLPKTF